MRFLGLVLVAAVMALPVRAQDAQTLADIRQQLEFVYAEILNLKRELSTTGTATQTGSTAPALQRLDTLEAEVRRITGSVEQKQNWIEGIVRDGTNRVADLEFQLCDLEANCNVGSLDKTEPLGGKTPAREGSGVVVQPITTGGQTTSADTSGATDMERSTFQRAMAAFEAENFGDAAQQFLTITENFPGGPLTGEAHYWRGAALAGQGDWGNAARSFLESFSGSPEGTKAPDALYRLGISLRELGQQQEACLMLSEVELRYPTATIVGEAKSEYAQLGCS